MINLPLANTRTALYHSPHDARTTCCDRGYGRPSGRPRVSDLATYGTSTPQLRAPVVARSHDHLHDLATASRA